MPGGFGSDEGGGFGGMQVPPNFQESKLTLSHVRDLEKMGPPIVAVAPLFETSTRTSYQKKSVTVTLMGTTEQYSKVRKLNIDEAKKMTKSYYTNKLTKGDFNPISY